MNNFKDVCVGTYWFLWLVVGVFFTMQYDISREERKLKTGF